MCRDEHKIAKLIALCTVALLSKVKSQATQACTRYQHTGWPAFARWPAAKDGLDDRLIHPLSLGRTLGAPITRHLLDGCADTVLITL